MSGVGKLVLVNGTDYAWKRIYHNSYQMFSFKFPSMVSSGSCEMSDIQFDKNAFVSTWQNEGDVIYELIGTSCKFSIIARIHSRFDIYVSYKDFSNLNQNLVKLEWIEDGEGFMQFYLCGRLGRFVSTGSSAGANCWMYENLDLLGGTTLNGLSVAGSHDSGMCQINWRTAFANSRNCQNQSLNIYEQLMCGIRFFDLRVVIGSSSYQTGHYALVGGFEYQGARGLSLDSVIEQINSFTACHNELLIISLSHSLNLDLGLRSGPFNQEELNDLCHKLLNINHRFISKGISLIDQPLEYFIKNKSAVLLILNESSLVVDPQFSDQGFYSKNEFPIFDKYSNTNNLNIMIRDQIDKMHRSKSHKNYFLLSWTLTQRNIQAFSSVFGPSISEMASIANSNLIRLLSSDLSDLSIKNFVKNGYPNVISLDYVSSDVSCLCLAINLFKQKSRKNVVKLRAEISRICRALSRRYLFLIFSLLLNYLIKLYFW